MIKLPISKRSIQVEIYRARVQSRTSTAFSKYYWEGYLLALGKAIKGIEKNDREIENLLGLEHSPNKHEQEKGIGFREALSFCTVPRRRGRQAIGEIRLNHIKISQELYNGLLECTKKMPHKSINDLRHDFLKNGIAAILASPIQQSSQDPSSR
jgi:hypothetical protein